MKIRKGVRLGNISDVGRERSKNEDYFGYCEPEDETLFAKKGRLAIIADGMGGMAGGYAASRIAVEMVREEYLAHAADEPRDALRAAIEAANAAIRKRAAEDTAYRGMGTTLTALVLKGGAAYIAQVGDSRAYRIRKGAIEQLTEDQTKINRLVKEGALTPEEGLAHPEANILSQAVGSRDSIDVDVSLPPQPTMSGDIFLLCSDGLHNLVAADEMAQIAGSQSPNDACRALVDLANERGGHDNITVQILEVAGQPAAASPTTSPAVPSKRAHTSVRSPRRMGVFVGVLLIFVVGVGAGYALFRSLGDPGPAAGKETDVVGVDQGARLAPQPPIEPPPSAVSNTPVPPQPSLDSPALRPDRPAARRKRKPRRKDRRGIKKRPAIMPSHEKPAAPKVAGTTPKVSPSKKPGPSPSKPESKPKAAPGKAGTKTAPLRSGPTAKPGPTAKTKPTAKTGPTAKVEPAASKVLKPKLTPKNPAQLPTEPTK